jgi:L-malate glycosyltransferase
VRDGALHLHAGGKSFITLSGLLVPFGDVAVLAGALEGLIHDKTRRGALGRGAQTRARERFSAEIIVPRYEALYRRLCR